MIVRDIFKFGGLKDAKLVAGKSGINNEIKSISVLEVAEDKIQTWVLQNQMYITSFYAIIQDIEKQKIVISSLHKKNAAGLVICHIDLFLKSIHPEVIKLCNELGFPLIVANSKVTYIEILNPIIFKLMEYSDHKYEDLVIMQNKLIEHIATKRDVDYIYRTMSELYGSRIFFLDINNQVIYPRHNKDQSKIIKLINKYEHLAREEYNKKGYCIIEEEMNKKIIVPVESNGIYYGAIITEFVSEDEEKKIKILKSVTSICTLIFTRSSRIKERESLRKQEYMNDLITWNFRTDQTAIKMGKDIGWDILNKCRMIVVNLNDIQKNIEINNTDIKKFIDEVLYNRAKQIVDRDNKSNIICPRSDLFLILLETDDKDTYERSKKVANELLECCKESFGGTVSIGISGDIKTYKDIPEAYVQATDAAKIGRSLLGDNKIVCYDDMGFYGVFKEILNINEFYTVKDNILKELKVYDTEENGELYITLKALIYNNMNTKATSEKLFIHPNTVNYRKNKIVEVLGYEPWSMPYLLNTLIAIVSEMFER